MQTKKEIKSCPKGEAHCPIYEDIAKLQKKIESLSEQVRTDFLTALFNKQHLLFSLEQEMERTARSRQATSLIILDIDHFKQVNDTHGHIVGDKVLVQVAHIIKDAIRKIDIPCRYGGEEFAIILPSSPILIGVQVAERLRKRIEQAKFFISDSLHLDITVSVGVHALLHNHTLSAEGFIARADKQLYLAKESGRNKVCHFIPDKEAETRVSSEEKEALFDAFKPKNK